MFSTITLLMFLRSFNPYFTGSLTATGPYICSSQRGFVGFQSLFYWKSYCNPFLSNSVVLLPTVSILILLEVLLQLYQALYETPVLFYVSILILLEVLLQPNLGIERKKLLESFNPYFTGSLTATCRIRS